MSEQPTTARGRATRDHILRAAKELIFQNGIASVRLEDVEHAASVGRSQLYHYFSDRDDLIRSVVHSTIDAVLATHAPTDQPLDSITAIDLWLDNIATNGVRQDGVGDCAIGLLATQLSGNDDLTRQAFLDAFTRWEQPLINGLRIMQDRGELAKDADVVELADLTMAAIQGGLLLAQLRKDAGQLKLALRGARAALIDATTPRAVLTS